MHDLAVDADDHSVVTLLSSPAELVVSDGTSVTRSIALPTQTGTGLAYDSISNRAYISTADGAVLPVQVDSGAVEQPVPTGSLGLADIAVHPATGRVFVADYNLRRLLVLGADLALQHETLLAEAPTSVVVAPDGQRAYVAHELGAVTFHGGPDFAVQHTVPRPDGNAMAAELAVSPDGARLYMGQSPSVAVLDTATGATAGNIPNIGMTNDLVAAEDGRLLVANDGRVRVYDAASVQQTGVAGVKASLLAQDGSTTWSATSYPATLVALRPSTPPSPLPRVSAMPATVEEGLPQVGQCCTYRRTSLRVQLDVPSHEWSQVNYRLDEPGTASPFDYVHEREHDRRSVLVPPGQLGADVPLDVFRDGANGEPDETLTLHLTGALGAEVATATATVTITDGGAAYDTTPPTVVLSGFEDGTDAAEVTAGPYREGAVEFGVVPELYYYCRDAEDSSPSCTATLDGARLESGAQLSGEVGTHRVVVTATDSADHTTIRTLTYTVVPGAQPTVTIQSPDDGARFAVGEAVTASWSCSDVLQLKYCRGFAGGAELQQGDPLPTGTPGRFALSVSTEDELGNTTHRFVTYYVDAPPGDAVATVSGGETVSTGATATADVPVQTSITVPDGVSGTLTVDAQPAGTSPAGFALFGQQLVIDGPVATAVAPYTVTFTVDSSALGGIAPSDVQVFRDGAQLTGCTSPTAAVPDPCIVSRSAAPDGSGDAVVTVRTSHFSTWTLGKLDYDLTGPFHPVDALPTVNTAKAGAAIPVKFKLGGDKGLDVLSAGFPKVLSGACGGGADEIEQTVSAGSSGLSYDAASGTYTYTWKTTKTPACKELVLKLRDGSDLRAKFNLR